VSERREISLADLFSAALCGDDQDLDNIDNHRPRFDGDGNRPRAARPINHSREWMHAMNDPQATARATRVDSVDRTPEDANGRAAVELSVALVFALSL
jgi:hypothetical protein